MPGYEIITAVDMPGMNARAFDEMNKDAWPEFMLNSPVSDDYWNRMYEHFPAFQFCFVEPDGTLIANGNAIPFHYEGQIADLPDTGWDWVLEKGVRDHEAGREANVVSAISITILADRLGQGLSHQVVAAMRSIVRGQGFTLLVAPVRPNLKPRYPLTPIDRYIGWQTPDGLPFDPWLRVHAKSGARIIKPCSQSMTIPGTVDQWERWAKMPFPESGTYVVPGALMPVEIDRENDRGLYIEPNVWMLHDLSEDSTS